ncbi:hypothetical protein CEUSTIGMA_g3998.t1 [Chlamydomonas eustigma]|uniref:Major facilitator superfamily (MFS) profile domain-containing protein n=1 Tax=Chlamydomonas eustigma TaxID=1157962 RepID=A0A250X0Y6_9CHLO|nr:hypothetical protein CEUSTIGMA_g3998.t1 [Chlamydomonas eustigma]|eukprot:GAX76552.1 hypothetical protein CEUSTIGMA_g3998.t1 [Chlamydomonas eustigma]
MTTVETAVQTFPVWFKPIRLLLLFTYAMLLLWIDQGTFSSASVMGALPDPSSEDYTNGKPGILMSLQISLLQFSILGSMYTVGLIIASFVFASLAQTLNEMRLLGWGMLGWAVGVMLTGLSNSFVMMLFARVLAGSGGGSVMTLTFPFIDDIAPAKHKTLWFGVLALAQPVGIALGYIAIAYIAAVTNWRMAFFTEVSLPPVGLSSPFVLFCLFAPALKLKNFKKANTTKKDKLSWNRGSHPGSMIRNNSSSRPCAEDSVLDETNYTAEGEHLDASTNNLKHLDASTNNLKHEARQPYRHCTNPGKSASSSDNKQYNHGSMHDVTEPALITTGKSSSKASTVKAGSSRRLLLGVVSTPEDHDSPHDLDLEQGGMSGSKRGSSSFFKDQKYTVDGQGKPPRSSSSRYSPAGPIAEGKERQIQVAPQYEQGAGEEAGEEHRAMMRQNIPSRLRGSGGSTTVSGQAHDSQPGGAAASAGLKRSSSSLLGRSGSLSWADSHELNADDEGSTGQVGGSGDPRRSRWQRMKRWSFKRWQGLSGILSHAAWNYNNFGYLPIELYLQVASYWGPIAVINMFPGHDSSSIDSLLGGTLVIAGLVGSVGGGLCLDWMGSSLRNAFRLFLASVTLGLLFEILAFGISGLPLGVFLGLSGFGIMCLAFVNPINYALSMWTIPPPFRPMSQAMLNFSQRAGADLYAATLAGGIQTALGNWHATYCICAAFMGLSMGMYFMGSLKGHQYTDFRKYYEAEEAAAIAAEAVQGAPCPEEVGNMTQLGKADEGEDESMSLLSVDDAEPSHSVRTWSADPSSGSKIHACGKSKRFKERQLKMQVSAAGGSKRRDIHAASPFQAENDEVGGNGGAAMPVTHPFQVSKSIRSLAPGYQL